MAIVRKAATTVLTMLAATLTVAAQEREWTLVWSDEFNSNPSKRQSDSYVEDTLTAIAPF